MVKDISCDCKCNLNSTTCNSKQKWNHESFQSECKKYVKKRLDLTGILAHVFARMASIKKVLLMIQKFCVMKL